MTFAIRSSFLSFQRATRARKVSCILASLAYPVFVVAASLSPAWSASPSLIPAPNAAELSDDPDLTASVLLTRARSRVMTGEFTAVVTCIRESYLNGRDTLTGTFESGNPVGERRMILRGGADVFEWWSRADGAEQWRREGQPGRLRRIPPHSRKKPAFAPDISFEDLARLPFGYFGMSQKFQTSQKTQISQTVRGSRETDSTISFSLTPDGALAFLYEKLEMTLDRRSFLLKNIEFLGKGGRPSKTLTVSRYTAAGDGMFPSVMVFSSLDGLSSVRLELNLVQEPTARDKAHAPLEGVFEGSSRFAEPEWVPRDSHKGTDKKRDDSND